MSVLKKVSVLQAITEFAQRTDDPLAKDHLLLLKLAKKVERDINTFKGHTLKAVAVVLDGTSTPVPPDAFRIEKIYPGDLTDDITNYYADIWSIGFNYDHLYDTDFIWSSLYKYDWIDTKLWDILNEEIVFPSGYINHELTIFYTAFEVDELGYMMVNESHIEAMAAYFKLFFAERMNWKRFRSQKMLRGGELQFQQSVKSDYLIARGQAKSDDLERTPMDRREIDGIY